MAEVRFHPDAEREYQGSLVWYGQQSRRAAQRFEREVDRALQSISESPERYPVCEDIYRQALLRKYPYSLIYRIESTGDVLVVAVAHASREPGYWQGRA